MDTKTANIILVDDHELFRDGIKTLIELNGIGKVIAEAENGSAFLQLLNDNHPDLVLMDIDMPVMNGVEASRKALEINPEIKILTLSMFGDEQYYYQMIEAGAKGFILKTSNKKELLDAIQKVLNGSNYFSNDLLQDIAQKLGITQSQSKNNHPKFNQKEIEILEQMLKGLSTDEIAEKINLSSKTISNYRTLMLEKTDCKNSISLIIYAIKNKVIHI